MLAFGILLVGILGLDLEGMCAEVISLSLQKICRQILGSIPVIEAQSGAEGGCRNTPESTFAHDISPSWLSLVDGLVEEVVEEQVLQFRISSICSSDVFQENRADDTSSTPHESNRWLVELPVVLLCCLDEILDDSAQHPSHGTYILN